MKLTLNSKLTIRELRKRSERMRDEKISCLKYNMWEKNEREPHIIKRNVMKEKKRKGYRTHIVASRMDNTAPNNKDIAKKPTQQNSFSFLEYYYFE